MNRLTQLVALSILMLASTMVLADRGSDRGRYHGQSNDHRSQQYGSYDRGHNNNYGNRHDNKYGNQRYANRNYDRHQNQHHNRYQNRRYAQYDRYRHRHNGRYCYARHAPGYAGSYGGPVLLAVPPVVALFPPRSRLYIGGTIVF